MAVLPKDEASKRLGIAVRSLEDKRYRIRIGLPAVRIGRRIGFDERDIERLVTCGREKILIEDGQEGLPQSEVLVATAGNSHA